MATRSKGKVMKNEGNKMSIRHSDNRVFFLDASIIENPSNDVQIISLRNPSTEKASKYLFVKEKQQFFEVMSFSEEPRSWFANDSVNPNGNLYITSPFDPLFWALYYIRMNNTERAQPIDQTVIDSDFANTYHIADILSVEQLSMIADQKGDASLKAFKYNESKALKWLSLKCKKLANALKTSNFHVGAKSTNYVKSEKAEDPAENDGELLSYAYGIVSDYITLELCEKLSDHLGLEQIKVVTAGKRKSLIELEHNTLKRIKSEEDFGVLDSVAIPLPVIKEKKVTTKEKKMAKAASGSKSISAFFTKK